MTESKGKVTKYDDMKVLVFVRSTCVITRISVLFLYITIVKTEVCTWGKLLLLQFKILQLLTYFLLISIQNSGSCFREIHSSDLPSSVLSLQCSYSIADVVQLDAQRPWFGRGCCRVV